MSIPLRFKSLLLLLSFFPVQVTHALFFDCFKLNPGKTVQGDFGEASNEISRGPSFMKGSNNMESTILPSSSDDYEYTESEKEIVLEMHTNIFSQFEEFQKIQNDLLLLKNRHFLRSNLDKIRNVDRLLEEFKPILFIVIHQSKNLEKYDIKYWPEIEASFVDMLTQFDSQHNQKVTEISSNETKKTTVKYSINQELQNLTPEEISIKLLGKLKKILEIIGSFERCQRYENRHTLHQFLYIIQAMIFDSMNYIYKYKLISHENFTNLLISDEIPEIIGFNLFFSQYHYNIAYYYHSSSYAFQNGRFDHSKGCFLEVLDKDNKSRILFFYHKAKFLYHNFSNIQTKIPTGNGLQAFSNLVFQDKHLIDELIKSSKDPNVVSSYLNEIIPKSYEFFTKLNGIGKYWHWDAHTIWVIFSFFEFVTANFGKDLLLRNLHEIGVQQSKEFIKKLDIMSSKIKLLEELEMVKKWFGLLLKHQDGSWPKYPFYFESIGGLRLEPEEEKKEVKEHIENLFKTKAELSTDFDYGSISFEIDGKIRSLCQGLSAHREFPALNIPELNESVYENPQNI